MAKKPKQSPQPRKKSNVMRIIVLILAVVLVIGLLMIPLQSLAIEANAADTSSVVVDSFETGKLSDALLEAADGTDYNYIKKAAVLSGKLDAADFNALTAIPNLEYVELAQTEVINGIIPENALPARNQLTYISLPRNTVEIGERAFSNNRKLVKISMPDSVAKIGDYAFEGCETLNEIPITENITYIGEGAFRDCKAIKSFPIPAEITEIYPNTFSKCGFSEITIHSGVTLIGDSAFADCNELKDIYVYGENTAISSADAFRNVSAAVHVLSDYEENYDSWNVNNLKVAGDLTGEDTAFPKEADENSDIYSDTDETEAQPAETQSESSEETAETTSEETVPASTPKSGTVAVPTGLLVIITIGVAVAIAAAIIITAIVVKKKK